MPRSLSCAEIHIHNVVMRILAGSPYELVRHRMWWYCWTYNGPTLYDLALTRIHCKLYNGELVYILRKRPISAKFWETAVPEQEAWRMRSKSSRPEIAPQKLWLLQRRTRERSCKSSLVRFSWTCQLNQIRMGLVQLILTLLTQPLSPVVPGEVPSSRYVPANTEEYFWKQSLRCR